MSQFAPVVSLGTARLLEQADLYGSYHLLLAHQILAEPAGWKSFLNDVRNKRARRHAKVTVLVDNSIVELGHPLPEEELLRAIETVQADYLFLPDCIDDPLETIWRSYGAAGKMHARLPTYCDFIGVAQGKCHRDSMICAEFLNKLPRVGALAVPKWVPWSQGSRRELVKEIHRTIQKPIHLLGFSGSLEDDIASAKLPGVMGIDSAVPIRLGQMSLPYPTADGQYPKRAEGWLEAEPYAIRNQTAENLSWIRSQLSST